MSPFDLAQDRPFVLGFAGSPRRGGNSEVLLERALEGAQRQGATVEKVVLAELQIAPCLNCDACLEAGDCPIPDDMVPFYRKLQDAHGIILASPIFWLSVTAQVKGFIDRCQSLWVTKYKLGRPLTPWRKRRPGLFIAVANEERHREFQPAIAVVRAFFSSLDIAYGPPLLAGGMESKGDVYKHPEALRAAEAAGERLGLACHKLLSQTKPE